MNFLTGRIGFVKQRPWLLVGLVCVLFLLAAKGAYKGYFHPDDLDNIAWTSVAETRTFLEGFTFPKFFPWNFRPLGHYYFRVLSRSAGLNFTPYVVVIQSFHLLNVVLLWLITATFGMRTMARLAAVIFFAFHSAVFDIYYRPMYVFDLFCATFCLLTILLWRKEWFWLGLVTFWCAYKSKELAILLPLVFTLIELWFGGKRWKRLIPFYLISLNFGVQALLFRNPEANAYSLIFTSEAVNKTLAFYTPLIFCAPLLLCLPVLLWARDRRVYFGLLMALLLFGPMLFVPGRLYGAYLYLPLAGVALAIGAFADRSERTAVVTLALLCLAWQPLQYKFLREYRNGTLAEGANHRAYVRGIRQISLIKPGITQVFVENAPETMAFWGTDGALRFIYKNPDLKVTHLNLGIPEHMGVGESILLLSWDAVKQRFNFMSHMKDEPETSMITMGSVTPVWQLEQGFLGVTGAFSWTAPHAEARLLRPEGAKAFEVTVNVGPDYIRQVKKVTLRVKVDGEQIGERTFTMKGWERTEWPVALKPAGMVKVEFDVDPPLKTADGDQRILGIPIAAFGYVE